MKRARRRGDPDLSMGSAVKLLLASEPPQPEIWLVAHSLEGNRTATEVREGPVNVLWKLTRRGRG